MPIGGDDDMNVIRATVDGKQSPAPNPAISEVGRPASIASYSAGSFSRARAATAWTGTLSEMGMVVVSSTVAVGPISQTLDAKGEPTGAAGEQLKRAFPRFAGLPALCCRCAQPHEPLRI